MSDESIDPAPPALPEGPTRAGFVGLAGVPNAGKSTLVNRIVGQRISIVSSCPQTTRHRLCAIWTEGNFQAVLVDVPGILETQEKFNTTLVHCAEEGLKGCDLILHLRTTRSAGTPDEARVEAALASLRIPVWQVWNKIDLAAPRPVPSSSPVHYVRNFAISGKTGKGVGRLRAAIAEALPEGPWMFPADDLSDRDLRFLAAERVREKAFLYLHKELPYSIATWTETWEEREEGKTFVRVVIQAERESHKSIIIGQGGEMLRKIGAAARRDIESLSGGPVYLELWVRVKPHWRRDDEELRRLGMAEGDSY